MNLEGQIDDNDAVNSGGEVTLGIRREFVNLGTCYQSQEELG